MAYLDHTSTLDLLGSNPFKTMLSKNLVITQRVISHSYKKVSIVSVGLRVFPFSSQRTLAWSFHYWQNIEFPRYQLGRQKLRPLLLKKFLVISIYEVWVIKKVNFYEVYDFKTLCVFSSLSRDKFEIMHSTHPMSPIMQSKEDFYIGKH